MKITFLHYQLYNETPERPQLTKNCAWRMYILIFSLGAVAKISMKSSCGRTHLNAFPLLN